jgi:hypothetical protein
MPITISLVYIFGISTLFIIKKLSVNNKIWYIPLIIGILFIYTNSDGPDLHNNDCEKSGLQEIANAKEETVALKQDCTILAWEKYGDPKLSHLNAQLLVHWRITDKKKYYFNK